MAGFTEIIKNSYVDDVLFSCLAHNHGNIVPLDAQFESICSNGLIAIFIDANRIMNGYLLFAGCSFFIVVVALTRIYIERTNFNQMHEEHICTRLNR